MINWQTTLGGIIAILAGVVPLFGVSLTIEIQTALMGFGMFIVALFAKDKNVTGGTKKSK